MNLQSLTAQERTIARQRERIEELEETLKQYQQRRHKGIGPELLFPVEWKLTPRVGLLLQALYRASDGFLTHDAAIRALAINSLNPFDVLDVQVHNLRKAVRTYGIEVINRHSSGYELPPASRAIIKAALENAA